MSDQPSELIVKGGTAILQCAAIRSVRRYNGHWETSFPNAFQECQKEYHQYLEQNMKK